VTITPVGVGDLDYAPSGFVRIGSEVMAYTRTGDDLTLVRAQGGTSSTSHKVGDTVQQVGEFDGETVQDILYELMTVGANINAAYIPESEWDAEQVAYLSRKYSALITAPTGVSKLIAELAEQIGFFMFWDEVGEKIRFKAIRPNAGTDTIYELTAERDILADSLSLKDLADSRVNEVWVYYGVIDTTKNLTEEANYKVIHVSSNVADQSVSQSNDLRIKKIFSRWISGLNGSAATELANRYIKRYARAPREVSLRLDAKDAQITLADFVQVQSRQSQDFSGQALPLLLQVTKRTESKQGTSYDITAREFAYDDTDFDTGLRVIEVNSDAFDFNIRDAYDAIYADAPDGKTVRVIIASGVLITSTSVLTPALVAGVWPIGVPITVENNGIVAGRGGNGGNGGGCTVGYAGTGDRFALPLAATGGSNGGVAIDGAGSHPMTFINNYILSGGGGGGGGGSARTAKTNAVERSNNMAICGAGAGGGWPYGLAGNGGLITGGSVESFDRQGNNGENGQRLTGGNGAPSVSNFSTTGGNGGRGGSFDTDIFGANGGNGSGGGNSNAAGGGGSAGVAIINGSNITIINNGQIISG